jgi:hypothetical protein
MSLKFDGAERFELASFFYCFYGVNAVENGIGTTAESIRFRVNEGRY